MDSEPQPIKTAPRDGTPIRVFIRNRWHDAVYRAYDFAEDEPLSNDPEAWGLRWAEIDSYGCKADEMPTHWLPQTPAP